MRQITKCPKCKKPLQATIMVYLSDVVVNEDGSIESFTIDNRQGLPDTFEEAIRELVDGAEGNELRVYCDHDHELNLGKVADDFSEPQEPPADTPSLDDTIYNHAHPRNR